MKHKLNRTTTNRTETRNYNNISQFLVKEEQQKAQTEQNNNQQNWNQKLQQHQSIFCKGRATGSTNTTEHQPTGQQQMQHPEQQKGKPISK